MSLLLGEVLLDLQWRESAQSEVLKFYFSNKNGIWLRESQAAIVALDALVMILPREVWNENYLGDQFSCTLIFTGASG
jgi:hypothetical protein